MPDDTESTQIGDDDDFLDDDDEEDVNSFDCGQYSINPSDGRMIYCTKVGSEECDFECPFSHEVTG